MQWVETTGRTLEEAKDAALDQLGVDESDAEFEILEEPKSGLFGRLRTEARVRARVRPTKPRGKDESGRDRRRRGKSGGGGGTGGSKQAPAPASVAVADDERRTDVSDDEPMVPLAEQGGVARDFLHGVVERMGTTATIDVHERDPETVEVTVEGDELGLLIGPKGATLSALQDLARTVVQRKTGARSGRLLIDVSGYRQRRKEALERFTNQLAAEVIASGRAKALEPMGAADRKVIHDTCNEIDGVTTTSEGEEPRRRVVIMPAT